MSWAPLRSDELAATIAWMREHRPNMPQDTWLRLAPGLELLLAMAAWRSQPVSVRARALADAFDVARPAVRPVAEPALPQVFERGEVARRPWTRDPIGPL